MKSAFCCRLVLINHPCLEVHNKQVVLRTAVVHDEYLDSPTPSVLRAAVVHAECPNSQHLRCFCNVTLVQINRGISYYGSAHGLQTATSHVNEIAEVAHDVVNRQYTEKEQSCFILHKSYFPSSSGAVSPSQSTRPLFVFHGSLLKILFYILEQDPIAYGRGCLTCSQNLRSLDSAYREEARASCKGRFSNSC